MIDGSSIKLCNIIFLSYAIVYTHLLLVLSPCSLYSVAATKDMLNLVLALLFENGDTYLVCFTGLMINP